MTTHVIESLDARTCRITIDNGACTRLDELLQTTENDGIYLIYDAAIAGKIPELTATLPGCWSRAYASGEAGKTLETAGKLAEELLEAGATRASLIVGVGGGVVCDLAAFIAAIYMRGVSCALVPTSMLAMVDAAIGGKNGCDLRTYKNIVGTIRQPDYIVIDPEFLDSLPQIELRDGLVEVVKMAAILDAGIFERLEQSFGQILLRNPAALLRTVEDAVAMKLAVVKADEREGGRRKLLNFGHTIGHALESRSGFDISHGAAVAVGMRIEMSMSGFEDSDRVNNLLSNLGCDLAVPESCGSPEALWQAMTRDKKSSHGRVYFAVPTALGQGIVVEADRESLEAAVLSRHSDRLTLAPLGRPFRYACPLPGSKSYANRAIVAAALANGTTHIHNATPCDDVRALVNGLQQMGFNLKWQNEETGELLVSGGIPQAGDRAATIQCGNAGTALRFLVSLAAVVPGTWILDGNARMRQRPVQPLVDAWRTLGADISASNGCPPVRVQGGTATGRQTELDATISSQFISSLMLAGSALPQGLTVQLGRPATSRSYVAMTRNVLTAFNVDCDAHDAGFQVAPGSGTSPGLYNVEGCWSSAGFFFVLAELTGSSFRGLNLAANSLQGDRCILKKIEAMRTDTDVNIDVSNCPDQLMNLAVLAASRNHETRFTGAANLRHKECDRLDVTVRELSRAGVTAGIHDDGIVVHGRSVAAPTATFDPEDDHRVAMAFSAMGLMRSGCSIKDPGCVSKSYPGFWGHISALRDSRQPIIVVGMRGAGKSTLAQALASALALPHRDSDRIFEQRHGSIAGFVERHGWALFRRIEAALSAELLQGQSVISSGGGALEDPETTLLIAREGFVVWIDEEFEILRSRLSENAGLRPSVTGAAITEELAELSARRRPAFESAADLRLASGLSTEQQCRAVLDALRELTEWPQKKT